VKSPKFFQSSLASTFAYVLAWLLSAPLAQAGYTITLQQVGPDVVATGSGAIDLTGLTFNGSQSLTAEISAGLYIPYLGRVFSDITTGPTLSSGDFYGGVTGPTSFGQSIGGHRSAATSGTGDMVGVFLGPFRNSLSVPTGYVSGSFLSDSATYGSQTLASLGVTPGTYVWAWGTGANQNFTLQIRFQPPTARPLVSISVSAAHIGEGDSATFQITAPANTIRPLVLNYTISGNATFGVDYGLTGVPGQSGQIVIPFGLDAVSINLTAFVDLVTEKKETVTMALQPGAGYKLSKSKKAKVIISKGATF